MSTNKKGNDKKRKKKKRTALVICKDRKQFWTTQTQFWQWVRESIVIKTGDAPLTGTFAREHEELMVVLSNTVLNLAHPNHLREALLARRIGIAFGSNRVGPDRDAAVHVRERGVVVDERFDRRGYVRGSLRPARAHESAAE